MESNTKFTLKVALFTLLIIAMGLSLSEPSPGIIGLEGYAHGVAFCDGGMDEKPHSIIGGVQWKEDGIRYVVNNNHENDPEIEDLVTLAVTTCAHLWY